MSRARLAALALLACPPTMRAAHGDEMVSTLMDASAGSARQFGREIVDLVRLGLRARATQSMRRGAVRVVADGLCLAAVWQMTLDLSTLLAQRARGLQDPLLAWPSIAALTVVLALALIGYDRLAGVGALTWLAARFPAVLDHHPTASPVVVLLSTALPLVCFAVMVLRPRRRTPDVRRLAWLGVPATLVATLGPPAGEQSPLLLALIALTVIVVALAALVTLASDPRLALAAAVPLTTLALGAGSRPDAGTVLLIATTPLVLAVALTGRSRAARRAARSGW